MVAQTLDDERWVQTVLNPAGTRPRVGSSRIWPGVPDAKNRATQSFVRSTDREPAWQTGEPQPSGPRGDDADGPLNGDADGPGGA